jgi:hypothetical protein
VEEDRRERYGDEEDEIFGGMSPEQERGYIHAGRAGQQPRKRGSE